MKNQIQTYRDSILDPFWNALFMPRDPYEQKYSSLAMRTDIKELEDSYEIDVELPGFKKEDIDLNLKDGYLTISVTKNESSSVDENSKSKYLSRERFYGKASRSYYLGDVDRNSIKAKFSDGVLVLSFPKEKEEKIEDQKIAIE